eukprot:1141197-Lingulodinium_polyedra.AAC.1
MDLSVLRGPTCTARTPGLTAASPKMQRTKHVMVPSAWAKMAVLWPPLAQMAGIWYGAKRNLPG